MSNPEYSVYRLDYWKPAAPTRITPCEKDDPDQNEIRISVAHETQYFYRKEDETVDSFHYRIGNILRLLRASFSQGRRYQAGVIREALEPRL